MKIENKKTTNFHIITLFPEAFSSYLGESIIKRAIEDKKIRVYFYNPRDFSTAKGARVDDRPYGGGPGMVIQALPVIKAIKNAVEKSKKSKSNKGGRKTKIVFFAPLGKKLDTNYAKDSSHKYSDFILVCGRYEGIDARIKRVFKMEDLSIGDYVVTGGELPAMIFLDSISRQIKGVLGAFDSLEENRISSHDVYTRPEVIEYNRKKIRVPKVLLSGNHKEINDWRSNTKNIKNYN